MSAVSWALSLGAPGAVYGGVWCPVLPSLGLTQLFKGGPHVCTQSVASLPQSEQWCVVDIRIHRRLWFFSFIPLRDTGSPLRPAKSKLSQSKLRPAGAGPSWPGGTCQAGWVLLWRFDCPVDSSLKTLPLSWDFWHYYFCYLFKYRSCFMFTLNSLSSSTECHRSRPSLGSLAHGSFSLNRNRRMSDPAPPRFSWWSSLILLERRLPGIWEIASVRTCLWGQTKLSHLRWSCDTTMRHGFWTVLFAGEVGAVITSRRDLNAQHVNKHWLRWGLSATDELHMGLCLGSSDWGAPSV